MPDGTKAITCVKLTHTGQALTLHSDATHGMSKTHASMYQDVLQLPC